MGHPRKDGKAPQTKSQRILLRKTREIRGYSTQLAARTGIPPQTISAYAHRLARPPSERAELLALADPDLSIDGWSTASEVRKHVARVASLASQIGESR